MIPTSLLSYNRHDSLYYMYDVMMTSIRHGMTSNNNVVMRSLADVVVNDVKYEALMTSVSGIIVMT